MKLVSVQNMEQNNLLNESTCENTINESKERSDNLARESEKSKYKIEWKPFLRQFSRQWMDYARNQILVSSGIWVSFFLVGLSMGAPTVFIPQMRREPNSTFVIDQEMASWLSSVIPYSGVPCAFILPAICKSAGRRLTFLIITLNLLAGYITLLTSKTVRDLLISEAMYGFPISGCYTIFPIIITEYTLPRYRGIFLSLKTASFFWGIWVSNAIGTFFFWKYIGYFGICCNVYVIVTGLFWYESPYWLATKGRFKECIESHRKLKGCSSDAEKELQTLLDSQKSNSKINLDNKNRVLCSSSFISNFIENISNEQFYKPTLVSMILMTFHHSSGKLACTIYAIELIKKITQSESTAYKGMLILDGVTVFGMYIGSVLARFLKRRTLMLCCSSSGVLFLFIISLYMYLIKLNVITENSILSILLLTFYQLSISCGPILFASSIYGEMVPIKFISYSIFAMGVYSSFLTATMIKISPALFINFGIHNAFLFYGVCGGICLILSYRYLPETKDKTLQEIGEYFKSVRTEAKELISKTDDNSK